MPELIGEETMKDIAPDIKVCVGSLRLIDYLEIPIMNNITSPILLNFIHLCVN